MSEFRSIGEIIQEYRGYAAEYAARADAWKAVTIKTRKNGEEYAELTARCVEGARIGYDFLGTKVLAVSYTCPGYQSDDIPVAYNTDRGGIYYLTPAETREKIAATIAECEERREKYGAVASWLDDNRDTINAKIAAFVEDLAGGTEVYDKYIGWKLGDVVNYAMKFGTYYL